MPVDLKQPMYSPTDRKVWPSHMFLHSLSSYHNSPSFHGESGNGMELANKGLMVQTCCASFPIYYYDCSPGLKGPLLFQA